MTVYSDLTGRALTALRRSMPKHKWDECADVIVRDRHRVEAHLREEIPAGNLNAFLPELKNQSYIHLPIKVANVDELRRYFDEQPVHKGAHVFSFDGRAKPLAVAIRDFPLAAYSVEQVVRAPGLIDVVNDSRLLHLIESYLGCVPTLYSLNAWWSHPATRPEMTNVQYFHRDSDDFRFLTLFIYLTDVGPEGGPHQVVPGSHSLDGMKELLRRASWWRSKIDPAQTFIEDIGEEFSSKCERLFGETSVDITGDAGSMFLVNTLALHRGMVPTRNPRLVVWARYGLGANTNSADLERGPVSRWLVPSELPDTQRNRYCNRLLLDFDRSYKDM